MTEKANPKTCHICGGGVIGTEAYKTTDSGFAHVRCLRSRGNIDGLPRGSRVLVKDIPGWPDRVYTIG